MTRIRVADLARRMVAFGMMTVYLAGCTTWRVQTGTPSEVLSQRKPSVIRVTLASGKAEFLRTPRIENDSLIGGVSRTGIPGQPDDRRAIPVDSVASISIERTHAGKTALLVVGTGLTILVIVAVIAIASQPTFDDPYHPTTSCPLVYSWDGVQWRLDSGTFGGAIMPAFARTDVDNLTHAVAEAGSIRLRMANELNETDYVDAVSLLAVDHHPTVTVAPSADGTIHTLGTLQAPLRAADDRGHDALDRVRVADGWSWESRPSGRDTTRAADIRDGLHLVFRKPIEAGEARLVVDGSNTPWAAYMIQEFVRAHGRSTQAWYDSVGSNPALARQIGAMMAREGFLDVQLLVDGRWVHQDFLWEAGPEVSKRQVIKLDLSQVESDSVEIRLESTPMFWLIDQVALDFSAQREIRVLELQAESAQDGQRRDVRAELLAPDRSYHVLATGDRTELSFRAPPVPNGMARSYLLRSTGWYHITAPEVKLPDIALLDAVKHEQHGASRVAVARFNDALRVLNQEAP